MHWHFNSTASYPDVPLNMQMSAQRKQGTRQRERRHFTFRLFHSHGTSRFARFQSTALCACLNITKKETRYPDWGRVQQLIMLLQCVPPCNPRLLLIYSVFMRRVASKHMVVIPSYQCRKNKNNAT